MHEFFMDAVPLGPHLLSLNIEHAYGERFSLAMPVFHRSLDGIVSTLLAIRKKPEIR